MKRILFLGLGCLVLLGVIGLGWYSAHRDGVPTHVSVGEKTYMLEVATTDTARAAGLGERDSLCSECAMLFLFERPGAYVFWMKGMRFPLDIAWLLDDRIVHIERRIRSDSTETYRSPVPANRVLEWNAGALDGIKVGDQVHFTP